MSPDLWSLRTHRNCITLQCSQAIIPPRKAQPPLSGPNQVTTNQRELGLSPLIAGKAISKSCLKGEVAQISLVSPEKLL